MMNWKGFARKRLWPSFKELSRHLPGATEKTTIDLDRDMQSLGPIFEPGTSQIRSRCVNHSATAFCTTAPLVFIPRQINLLHTFLFDSSKISFNTALSSVPRSSKWSFPFRFSDLHFEWISHHSHVFYMSCPSHPSSFDHLTNICCMAHKCRNIYLNLNLNLFTFHKS
jgi:hypothetical protein